MRASISELQEILSIFEFEHLFLVTGEQTVSIQLHREGHQDLQLEAPHPSSAPFSFQNIYSSFFYPGFKKYVQRVIHEYVKTV